MTVELELACPQLMESGRPEADVSSGETVAVTAALVPNLKASRLVIFSLMRVVK